MNSMNHAHAVLHDYMLEVGFTRLKAEKALAALDPAAVVLTRDEIARLDRDMTIMTIRHSEWRRPGEPVNPVPNRAQYYTCTMVERDMLDIIKAKREGRMAAVSSPWGKE